MDFLDRFLPCLAESEMANEDRRVKAQRIHILTCCSIHLSSPRQHRTLRLSLSWCNDIRDAHQLQELLALRIMLSSHPNSAPGELLHILRCSYFFRFFEALGRFGFAGETFGEFSGLELWWCAVEDVDGFDSIVDDAESAVEHA